MDSTESLPDGFSTKGSQFAYSKNELRKTIHIGMIMWKSAYQSR